MIDAKTIEQISKLARLKITAEEATEYGQQLTKVLEHFHKISKIDTTGVEPLVTPAEIDFYARPDESFRETTTEEMLANAPEKSGNLFKVPPVV